MESGPEDDLITSITPDVMRCLDRSEFFDKLDDLLCPNEASLPRKGCGGDYKLSESVLRTAGFDSEELADIFGVLRSQGGCCDCEILYNLAESSRLKAEYWRGRAKGLDARPKHDPQ
jgi:hypothetical protein